MPWTPADADGRWEKGGGGVQRLRENTGHSDVTGPLKRLEKDSDAPPACFYGDSLR